MPATKSAVLPPYALSIIRQPMGDVMKCCDLGIVRNRLSCFRSVYSQSSICVCLNVSFRLKKMILRNLIVLLL